MNLDVLMWCFIILLWIFIIFLKRIELRAKKIKENGLLYKKIVCLNEKNKLNYFNRQLKFHKNYQSKSTLDNADLTNAALQYISENLQYVENMIQEYERCLKQYQNYINAVRKILKTKVDYSSMKLNKVLFNSLEDYADLEIEMIENIIKQDGNKLSLYILLDYTSPKGQNYWIKECIFSDENIIDFVAIVNHHEEYTKSIKYQRTILSDSLRYDILKRDNFTCQLCGASSKKDGVKLEVDHIFPVSKGGKTEPQNLQTLCERCNRGKSDKI